MQIPKGCRRKEKSRKEKFEMKRIRMACSILIMTLMLSACGGGETSATKENSINKNAVFKEETGVFALEEGDISQLVVQGDTLYVEQYVYNYEKPQVRTEEAVVTEDAVVDGAMEEFVPEDTFAVLRKITGYSVDGAVKSQFESVLDSNCGAGSFAVDKEGNVYSLIYQYATSEGNDNKDKTYLKAYAADGTIKWEIYLNENISEEEYFYISSVFCNENNQIILDTSRGIEVYDNQGNPVKLIEKQNGNDSRLLRVREGKFALASSDGTTANIQTLDIQSGILGEKVALPFNYYRYQINQGKVYDIYLCDDYGVYGYNIGDGEITKIMDYISSDFSNSILYQATFLDENTFVAYYYDDKAVLAKFTKVPPEEVVDKTELIVGCYYLDNNIKEKLVEFNKKNQEYRLNVKDYSAYDTMEDYSQGLTRLNADIVSGNIPDIMLLNTQMPFESFASKGIFADLNTFLEKDTELKKEDLLPNVLKALSSGDGMYRISPSFSVTTFAAKTADVGKEAGWTMDEAMELLASKPEGTQLLSEVTASNFLYYTVWICGEQYVNWDTGKCSFDSEGFIKTLEYAKSLPKEIDYSTVTDDESYWQEMELQYRNGKTILNMQYLSGFRDYNYAKQGVFGEDITLIGFPVDEGMGAGLSFTSPMAISALSKHQDVAWEFVKTFFMEEYQESLNYDFPVRVDSLKKLEEKAWEKPYHIDEQGNKHEYDDYIYVNGVEMALEPMKPEETAELIDYLYKLDSLCIYNETIYNIVMEEAAGFLEGQKTAEEVADVIQSRVEIYVSENS